MTNKKTRLIHSFKDLLDMNYGMYFPESSVLRRLLEYSPKAVHREVYRHSFLELGGQFPGAVVPRNVEKILLDGRGVILMADDMMATYDHIFTLGKESLHTGPASYYYTSKLPIKKSLDAALMRMGDTGVVQEVVDN